MHALFLTTRINRPPHRFRVEQMLPFWTAAGHTFEVQIWPHSSWSRIWNYRHWSKYDVVLVQQRTFSPWELHWLRKNVRKLVFDVDDAVMFKPDGRVDARRRTRFDAMIRASDTVICGNQYLADFCTPGNRQVVLIPTVIDTQRFQPQFRVVSAESSDLVTIGWTGSGSSVPYLQAVLPEIGKLPADRVRLKFISDTLDGLDLSPLGQVPYEFIPWTPENESQALSSVDIGIMPVPDTSFTRGKCGCKALQYMALGIPSIVSPVGVNREIITHDVNGYHATSSAKWFHCMQQLVADQALRRRIGQAGLQTVQSQFSLAVHGQRFVQALAG